MFDLFNKFAVDEKKEVEGVEISLGDGAFITVARSDNQNFNEKILEASEKHLADIKALPKKEAVELDRKILCGVMAGTILTGFRGMSYKGKALKYSVENATMLLLELKEFFKLVRSHSMNIENYRVKIETDDVKN